MSRLLILYLCGLTLRSLIFAALAGLVTMQMRSVARRHAVWTVFLGCLLLMPMADALLPAAMVPARAPEIVLPVQTFVVIPPTVATQPRAFAPAFVPELPRWDWWQVAAFVWVGVASAFLFRLVLAYGAIVRIKRAGQPVSRELMASHRFGFRTPTLRESGDVTIPLTVGLWNPVLILPLCWRDWDDWKIRAVLAHELTHVRRLDWAITVTASLVRSVFWFNPLGWWLERHLSSLAEQASDEACVQATGDAPRYAETLLQFASVAKHGRRWSGGVAMAQYKISSRIERVLRLQNAGSGVLSRAGWVAVCVLAIPALYVSATAQSLIRTQVPTLSAEEIVRVLQQPLPLPEQTAIVVAPTPQQPAPAVPATPPAPAAQAGVPAPFDDIVYVNPAEVGFMRAATGQVQIGTRQGIFSGNAVWNVRNGALNPSTWAGSRNWNVFTFAMTGAQGRTLSFETNQGGTFSYGCPDCSFIASEAGVGALSANTGTGIIFRLSSDGKAVTATCRAVECFVGLAAGARSLKDSETMEFGVPQQPAVDPNNTGKTCFSVFGNVKADGTPFTAADCPGGVAVKPAIFFSVTR